MAIVLASALSRMPILTIGPVQPNLVLIVLLVTGFFTGNAFFFGLLVALAAMLVRQTPVLFDVFSVGTAVSAFAAFFIKQHVVWPDRLGVVLLIICATFFLHLIVAPGFILAHFGMFALEVVLSIVIGLILFELFSLVVGRRHE